MDGWAIIPILRLLKIKMHFCNLTEFGFQDAEEGGGKIPEL